MNDEFADELMEMFFEEAKENLQMLEEGLLGLECNKDDLETVHVIFRCMHTIKGGADLVGLKSINQFTHNLENLLDEIRRKQIELQPRVFQVLFAGVDVLKKALDERDFSSEVMLGEMEKVTTAIASTQQTYGHPSLKSAVNEDRVQTAYNQIAVDRECYRIHLMLQPSVFKIGVDPLMLLNELNQMGKIIETCCDTSHLPTLDLLDPSVCYLQWTVLLETDKGVKELEQVLAFVVEDNQQVSIEKLRQEVPQRSEHLLTEESLSVGEQENKGKQIDAVGSTIRVDADKLESILNHLGELLIFQSRVKELILSNMDVITNGEKHGWKREVIAGFEDVDKTIRVIQAKVMNASMVSIGGTFTRYQRMIRDLAKEIGKEVEVEIEGKETELDKRVVEQIADPLKHLIRNALDHGLESAEVRKRAGKSSRGLIMLKAFHQEGSIVIQISDDGKGIDEQAIRAKALSNHIITEDQQLSRRELYMLLFQPGFSTAGEVTGISGRGVGLDVVMNNIKRLRGSVEIDSEWGKGTVITIKLPLTLAIIEGMMVRVGQERFVIPINMICEFYKESQGNIHRVEGKGAFVHLRGENLPFAALYRLLNIEAECHAPSEGIMVVLQHGQRKLAVMVDEILGQEQVVIKSLRENMPQHIEGVAGVTILGNGNVAIILDIPTIFSMVSKRRLASLPTGR